ncbi:hypothetical protein ACX3YD_22255 [Pseudomonas fluorescens group sp. PF-1]
MNKHDIAVGMIDSRFEALNAGNSTATLHAETSMAIEMAHSLGAICMDEHRHYNLRLNRIYEAQAERNALATRRAS